MNNDKTENGSNGKDEKKGTPENPIIGLPPSTPIPAIPSFESTADDSGRVPLTNLEGVTIKCFACYTEQAIEGTMMVLQAILENMDYEDQEGRIEEGLKLAEFTLQEYLEELRTRHHGEGLPTGSIPVRPIPFIVPEKM